VARDRRGGVGGRCPPTTAVESAEYWRERLAGAAAVELATDRSRITAREYRGAVEELVLPDGTRAMLEATSVAFDVSRFTLMLAAFYVVLHRHTGQTDLLVGTVRDRLDEEGGFPAAGGPFATVVPLRTALDPGGPFADLLRRTHGTVHGACRHECALHEEGPDRRLNTSAVRVALNHLAGPWPGPRLPTRLRDDTDRPPPALDLDLTVDDSGSNTILRLRYNVSLFARATAAWLLRHYATVLSEATLKPRSPIRQLRLQEEQAADPAWSLPAPAGFVPPAPAAASESLVDRFRSVAAEHGDRVAVTGPSGQYGYAELDRLTTAVARRLGSAVGPGQRVGLLCGHDIGMPVGVWSVLKTGATYVPLDPRQPDGRLTRIVADADVAAIACDPDLVQRASAIAKGRPVIALAAADAGTDAHPLADVPPGAVAYLLHTSGSTGRPKAVVQSHRNVLAHALAYVSRLRIGPHDHVPLLSRFTFDAGVMDVFGGLLAGASLHIAEPALPAPELRRWLAEAGATVLHCTPTLFRHLVGDLDQDRDGDGTNLACVRVVVLGGEEATHQDLRQFFGYFPKGCSLVNGLGPTECTLALQYHAARADLAGGSLPVGYPVDGVRVRLLDGEGHPTEIRGELEILSDRVAHGYWRQDETTAAVFGEYADGTRYYRTGDLARQAPDGALVYCGRKDRQTKIRGHRVEPGEVEALLRAHPTVAQAAVTVDQRAQIAQLVGYVTSATSLPPDPDQLAGYLSRFLPDYAVPWRLVVLETMPLGPTGKLDRLRLPVPQETPNPAVDRPRTPLEQALAGIWCQVLGISEAGLRANFMASGGDSIRLLELLAKVQDVFETEIPLAEFLTAPTIATMARVVERGKSR